MTCGNCGGHRTREPLCSCIPPGFWEHPEVLAAVADCDGAQVVRLLRKLCDLDQVSVGAMIDKAQSTISRYEGGRAMNLEHSLQVFKALGAPEVSAAREQVAFSGDEETEAVPETWPHLQGKPKTALKDVVQHLPSGPPLLKKDTGLGREAVSRPVGLRPHIEKAFAADKVHIDFAGFSSETLYGALQEPLDRVREGVLTPKSIQIRILVPDLSEPRGLPALAPTGQDDPQVRARMRRIMLRYTQSIEDLIHELGHRSLLQTATLEVKLYPVAPMFKIYLINRTQAFFGFYPVKENLVSIGETTKEIYDLMGRDSVLFHHTTGETPGGMGKLYVEQAQAWFDSIWNSIARKQERIE